MSPYDSEIVLNDSQNGRDGICGTTRCRENMVLVDVYIAVVNAVDDVWYSFSWRGK